jgi:hypothetical protein
MSVITKWDLKVVLSLAIDTPVSDLVSIPVPGTGYSDLRFSLLSSVTPSLVCTKNRLRLVLYLSKFTVHCHLCD